MNFIVRLTFNPEREIWQRAKWMPDRFGKGGWGVAFPGRRGIINASKVHLITKNG